MTLPIFCDCPFQTAAEKIAQSYTNGVVGLAGPSVYPLARLLAEKGNSVVTGNKINDSHVRLIVGGGGDAEMDIARRIAADKKLVLLPSVCRKSCFISFRDSKNAESEPDYVIYGLRDDNQLRSGAYAAMLGLLAECADAAVCSVRDYGYSQLTGRIRRLLDSPISFPAWAEFIARASQPLRYVRGNLYERLAFCVLPGEDAAFFTNYLICAVLIQFTKYDFHGIFIGKEKCLSGLQKGYKNLADKLNPDTAGQLKDLMPPISKLNEYAQRYLWEAGKKRFDAPPGKKVFAAILEQEDRADGDGLLASLCRAGFLDKLM